MSGTLQNTKGRHKRQKSPNKRQGFSPWIAFQQIQVFPSNPVPFEVQDGHDLAVNDVAGGFLATDAVNSQVRQKIAGDGL